jgi:hypothetical protein
MPSRLLFLFLLLLLLVLLVKLLRLVRCRRHHSISITRRGAAESVVIHDGRLWIHADTRENARGGKTAAGLSVY